MLVAKKDNTVFFRGVLWRLKKGEPIPEALNKSMTTYQKNTYFAEVKEETTEQEVKVKEPEKELKETKPTTKRRTRRNTKGSDK